MRLVLLIVVVTFNVANAMRYNDDAIVFPDSNGVNDLLVNTEYSESGTWKQLALDVVTHSANAFSGKFVEAVGESISGNLICSPISASMVLSMAAFGAQSDTEQEMRAVLELPRNDFDIEKIGFQALIDSFASYQQVELRLANKIYLPIHINPKPEFMEITRRYFHSEAERLDFHYSESSTKIINKWCEKQTNNRIKDIISPDDINDQTALVLVNAVYFKGIWLTEFDVTNTSPLPFYVNGITKKLVPTMYVRNRYRYGKLSKFNAKFVELPYKSEDSNHAISMFIILPNNRTKGLAYLEENFRYIDLAELINRGEETDVKLRLPKFKIESTIPLQEPLERIGMKSIFKRPNFTGIIDTPPLRVTKIVQKAFIEIDEKGSEAAAATAMGVGFRSLFPSNPAVQFFANHPFIAIIATTNSNPVNLFTARYTGSELE